MLKTNQSNEDLMILYQNGSYDAFLELYQRYGKRAYAYLQKNLHKKNEADDLLQKIFLKMHTSKHLYKKEYLFEQWFFIIARSALFDFYRQNKKKLALTIEDLGWDFDHTALQKNQDQDHLVFIKSFSSNLSDDEAKLIKLKYLEDYSYKEMTDIFQKSEIGLRQMLSRALKKIKKGAV